MRYWLQKGKTRLSTSDPNDDRLARTRGAHRKSAALLVSLRNTNQASRLLSSATAHEHHPSRVESYASGGSSGTRTPENPARMMDDEWKT
jgi:hypothetical protein